MLRRLTPERRAKAEDARPIHESTVRAVLSDTPLVVVPELPHTWVARVPLIPAHSPTNISPRFDSWPNGVSGRIAADKRRSLPGVDAELLLVRLLSLLSRHGT
jgi:hypothetical protein